MERGISDLHNVFSRLAQAEESLTISTNPTDNPSVETFALYSFAGRGSIRGHGLPPRGGGNYRGRGIGHGESRRGTIAKH